MLAPKPSGGTAAPAFERLYRRHMRDVYRYAAAMLPNTTDAEDVVQTTFLNAFRAFEQGQRPQRPLSWLMAIAHNICRQRFRQQSHRPHEVTLDENVAAAAEEEARVSAADIRRALAQLGFNQRTALVMRELEGRSYAEIAERLELSHSAVETLIFRARRALREQLDGALTCHEAERAISRQLDELLAHEERGPLRAHLRTCPECRALARRMRGRRKAVKPLGALPLPASLTSFSLTGGRLAASLGARALVLKLAGAATALVLATGAGYETVHTSTPAHHAAPVRTGVTRATSAAIASAPAVPPGRPTPRAARPVAPAPRTPTARAPHVQTAIPSTGPVESAPPTSRRGRAESAVPGGQGRGRVRSGGAHGQSTSDRGRPADPGKSSGAAPAAAPAAQPGDSCGQGAEGGALARFVAPQCPAPAQAETGQGNGPPVAGAEPAVAAAVASTPAPPAVPVGHK